MRPIRRNQAPLMAYLLEEARRPEEVGELLVEDMDDEGMGSLRFLPSRPDSSPGFVASECEFKDSDGVSVLAALYLDDAGSLLELDVWKVDFSPLRTWPSRGQLTRIYTLDVKSVASRDALHSRIARTLQFPDYYGMNWDAFDECIFDIRLPARVRVLGVDQLRKRLPEEAETMIRCFVDASNRAAPCKLIVEFDDRMAGENSSG
jgi:RNAse (barnase) inhibitor barstar